ncbi:MAG TPA: DNA polymerase III subunit delta [Pasteurellaceae bacterium]|nr:DNA polymerase III subunit delta [Pasteurellaceae bacterium]
MNRIFAEQLANSLNNKLSSIYYLVGQDPLLLGESQDLIVQTASAQGFDEKFELQVDNATDWNELFKRCQSMGLFFNKQIIILKLPENLTALLQQKLTELITLLNSDILLILQLPKLNKKIEGQDWFKQAVGYESHPVLINCQTPTAEQLPRWVSNRTKAMGLHIEQEAIQLLCHSCENNLLALKQNLQLLASLYPDHKLSFVRVKLVIEQSSQFTSYQWIDALLEGKENRARRILSGLRQGGDVQPVMLLRALQRELMILLELSKPQQCLANLDDPLPLTQLREGFDRLKIWQNRRQFFIDVFHRLTYRRLYLIFQQVADLERAVKQDFSTDIWEQLIDLSVKICFNR